MPLNQKTILAISGFIIISGIVCIGLSFSQETKVDKDKQAKMLTELYEKNKKNCLCCHGQKEFALLSADSSETIISTMCEDYIIDSANFLASNHKVFQCIDCHTEDYLKYPHPRSVRFEKPYSCLDCHSDDPELGHLNFEAIQTEYEKSIHYKKMGEEKFSCWKCHEPHSYSLFIRKNKSITDIVKYNNNACLQCHTDFDFTKPQKATTLDSILSIHDWLPNQSLHFKKIRCIDCHAQTHDSILVAHHILAKDSAVNECIDCHSQNNILQTSLYKHRLKEAREKHGFMNAVVMNEHYVIGANRNYYLNVISFAIFILTIAGTVLHAVIRFITRKKQQNV